MHRSRRIPLLLSALVLAGVACQDLTTAARAPAKRAAAFEVGPTTYSALWTMTGPAYVLRSTFTPAGPVAPSRADTARATALREQFRGLVAPSTLRSLSAPGSVPASANAPAGTRRAMRMVRVPLGKVKGHSQTLGLVPGEGKGAPLAALVFSTDQAVTAVVQLQHARRANGKWRLAQSRTTVFGADRKAVAAIDQTYGDPEFASAWREGSLTLMKRFASLALPDALYASAAYTEDEDAEALCPDELKAVAAAGIAVALASANVVRATALEAAAVGALTMALATCPEGGCLFLVPLEAAITAATANLGIALALEVTAIATGVAAAANLADCLWTKRPSWIPSSTGSGGGGGEGDGGGTGGGGGGGGYYPNCEFYMYVDYWGNILEVDDPRGCLFAM